MRTAVALALGIAAVVAGCVSTPAPAGEKRGAADGAREGTSDVRMVATTSDDSIGLGEGATIDATAKNHGNAPFVYDHPGCPAETIRFWVVVNGQEREITSEGLVGACVINERRIEPGSSVSGSTQWDGSVDGQRLPDGTYTVIARLSAARAPYVVQDDVRVEVRTI